MSKIDFDKIIYNEHSGMEGYDVYDERQIKAIKSCMKKACLQVLDEAIKSFPSHEYPEITKAILEIKEEL